MTWTGTDEIEANREGWGLFESDTRGLEIERLDEADLFDYDEDAVEFVHICAGLGSKLHQRALLTIQKWHADDPFASEREDPGEYPPPCTNPGGHQYECTGTAYGGDDESYMGEGRCLCIFCGADGDA